MRKVFFVVLLLALAVMVAVPAMAQDRPSIPELLTDDADGRFTTLLAAVEAAGLGETLSGEGPFTVLAPTDDAFAAAFELLGITAEDALANPELLTSILLYHVVPGSYFFRDLTTGPTLDTALEGSTVSFNLTRGVFTVNNINIGDVDNLASNGIVHVIDGVLLPPSAAMVFGAHIRVAHFSPDAPNVDVFVNFGLALEDVPYQAVSEWMLVPAGVYNVAVSATGTGFGEAVIGPLDLSLAPGSWTTVAAIGSLEAGTLTAQAIPEQYGEPGDTAVVTVFHAIEGAPAVDVSANGNIVIAGLAFPGTSDDGTNDGAFTLEVPAGTYDLAVLAGGASILDLPGTELVAGMNYLVAAIGTPDAPAVSVTATDPMAVAEMGMMSMSGG
jgi:uncharacterized surface protein with fasciclin (FAS1) repeats